MFRSIRRTTNLRRWRNEAPVPDVHVPLIPAKAGIQRFAQELDARLRGHTLSPVLPRTAGLISGEIGVAFPSAGASSVHQ
jgi:hypothetical protein